jgi:hypothetical protein
MEQKCSGNTKLRTAFFTINNCDKLTEEHFKNFPSKYYIYQIEKGEKGTEHLQGILHFENPISFKSIKKNFPTAHIEKCMNINNSIKYCSKEESRIRGPYENGTKPEQGKRSDLITIKNQIMLGNLTCETIRYETPDLYHQYGRTLEKLETDYMNKKKRNFMTKGIWLWGKTGSGKSYIAETLFNGSTYKHTTKDKGWWDNYKQQDIVIIDDFRGEIDYNEMLKICDRYEYYVSRRNIGPISFYSKYVIITSSLKPEEIYNRRNEEDGIEQLYRRFEVENI